MSHCTVILLASPYTCVALARVGSEAYLNPAHPQRFQTLLPRRGSGAGFGDTTAGCQHASHGASSHPDGVLRPHLCASSGSIGSVDHRDDRRKCARANHSRTARSTTEKRSRHQNDVPARASTDRGHRRVLGHTPRTSALPNASTAPRDESCVSRG